MKKLITTVGIIFFLVINRTDLFSLIITEANPAAAPDYVEIYNDSNTNIDLSGIMASDESGSDSLVAGSTTTLPPGGFAVIHWGTGTDEVDSVGDINGNGYIDLYTSDTALSGTDEIIALYYSTTRSAANLIDALLMSNGDGSLSSTTSNQMEEVISFGGWTKAGANVAQSDCVQDINNIDNAGDYGSFARNFNSNGNYIDNNNKTNWLEIGSSSGVTYGFHNSSPTSISNITVYTGGYVIESEVVKSAGGKFYVKLVGKDLHSGSRDKSNINIKVIQGTGDTTGILSVELIETGTNTGIFTNSVIVQGSSDYENKTIGASSGSVIQVMSVADTTKKDLIGVDVPPAILKNVVIDRSKTGAGSYGTYTINFTPTNPIPPDGKIRFVFNTNFILNGITGVTTTSNWGGTPGTFIATVTGYTVTVTRQNDGTISPGNERVNLILTTVTNSTVQGEYTIEIETRSNNNVTIDGPSTSVPFYVGADVGSVVINEVVTDPQVDWSTTGFDGTDGGGTISTTDEWLELYIKKNGLNLTGWVIKLIDGTDVVGDLTSTGAFDVSRYITNVAGNFTNTGSGDYLVLGNPDGSGSMANDITIRLYDSSSPYANLIDVVTIGQYDDGNVSDNAPDGGVSDGNATGVSDEAIARIPNGIDTDNNANDFIKKSATIGKDNDNSSISLNNSYYIGFVTFATVTLIEPNLNTPTTNCIVTNISYANSRLKVTLYSNGKNSYGYTIYKGSFSFTNNALSGNNKLGVTNSKTNYFKAKYYDISESELKESSTSFWIATTPPGFTAGDIVINEFQTISSDPVSDAIELYNKTGTTISLNGWKLKDLAGNIGYSFSTETITSNGYLILKNLSSEWNNTADSIVLENSYGTIIDKIYYSAAPSAGSTFARIPNGTWSGTNVSSDFQIDTTPTLGWNNDSTANLGEITPDKLFYFTTSSTCHITLKDNDNPANPVIVVITNISLGSTNSFRVTLASNGNGIYTGYFRFSTNLLNTNSKIMYVTNGNSIQILYTDSDPVGIQSYKNIKWYKNIPPNIKISEIDVRGRWAGDTKKEFVELYNATGNIVNLTNWKIIKDGGATLITLSGEIQPYGFYLCGETTITDINGFSPDQTWAAGYKLSDSDFGIQLLAADGAYVDSVGWGDATGIDDGYYEGTPLTGIGSSEIVTYERKASSNSTAVSLAPPTGSEYSSGNAFDSDDNSVDFVKQSSMNPQSSKSPQEPPAHSVVITVNTNITNVVYRGYTNIVALSFNYTDGLDKILKKIKIQNIGSATISDISNIKLWYDINSDYQLDAGDSFVTLLNWNNSDSWTNNNLTLSSGTTNTNGNYLITISIKSNPTFGHTFIASVPVGGVKCEYGLYNTTGIYNNGYILIDSRPPTIGTNLVLTKSSVSNNNTSTFSFWTSITNKGDGVKYKIEWYGYENNPNYPSYIFDATNGNIYTNSTATVPKSVTPTNYILVLKVYDSQMYRSNYVTTLPSILTVSGFFPPNIKEFSADKTTIILNGDVNLRTINFTTVATDRDTSLINLTSFITNLNVINGPSITNMNYNGDGMWKYTYIVPSTVSQGIYSIVTKVTDNTGYYKLNVLQLTLKSNSAPIANAGNDQTVSGKTKVVLDGANSVDPDGDALSYKWEVVNSSDSININNNSAVKADFIAPNITGAVIVKLTVTDIYGFSASDTVTININKSFRKDLSEAHPYNTVIKPDKNSVKFVNLSEGTVVTIYTITGNKVATINATEDEVEWQFPNYLAAGVYIVYMKDNAGHTKKMKIIVVR